VGKFYNCKSVSWEVQKRGIGLPKTKMEVEEVK
jgi:hypothetical protein